MEPYHNLSFFFSSSPPPCVIHEFSVIISEPHEIYKRENWVRAKNGLRKVLNEWHDFFNSTSSPFPLHFLPLFTWSPLPNRPEWRTFWMTPKRFRCVFRTMPNICDGGFWSLTIFLKMLHHRSTLLFYNNFLVFRTFWGFVTFTEDILNEKLLFFVQC